MQDVIGLEPKTSYIYPPQNDNPLGVLDESICYLAGAMDRVDDAGVGWRRDLIRKAHDKGVRLRFLDPTDKLEGMSVQDERSTSDELAASGDWEGLREHVRAFRREDLRCCDYCDLMIIRIDVNVHMCGSYDELFNAERQRKPILAIVEGGIEKLPRWLFAVLKMDEIFDSVDQCVNYLDNINRGMIKLDNRWVLIRQQLNRVTQ